jgi:hypothetical protein
MLSFVPAVSGTFLTFRIFVQAQANQRGSLGLGWTADRVETADRARPVQTESVG